jgi:hypothetical protein
MRTRNREGFSCYIPVLVFQEIEEVCQRGDLERPAIGIAEPFALIVYRRRTNPKHQPYYSE